jgi:hypothetical protein
MGEIIAQRVMNYANSRAPIPSQDEINEKSRR